MITLKARLVMESRGLAPAVRSLGLHSDWSRLYQANTFYLDLMLKPKDKTSNLIGQLLSEASIPLRGEISLLQDQTLIHRIQLGRDAEFLVEVKESGIYQLSISLGDTTISVPDLSLH
jgi:hypothetical protein